jgi:hypothetical protein
MYYPPPPQVKRNTVAWFFIASGVLSCGFLGVKGLILWLLPGVPPPGPLG